MTLNKLPKPLQTLLELSKRQVAKVNLTPSENTWQADKLSKIGGIGYLPIGERYPVNKQGEPLALLFQLNFEQLANEVDISQLAYQLPNKGILQVYIGNTKFYGLENFDNYYPSNNYQVRFWQDCELPLNDIALSNAIQNLKENTIDLPFNNKEFQYFMDFDLYEQFCHLNCFEYKLLLQKYFPEILNSDMYEYLLSIGIDNPDDSMEQYYNFVVSQKSQVLGYPNFVQTDFRNDDKEMQEYISLFQLETKYYFDNRDIEWRDGGVANFFIHPNDLKNKDFSKLVFHWDCY